jgi:hypothetical protein
MRGSWTTYDLQFVWYKVAPFILIFCMKVWRMAWHVRMYKWYNALFISLKFRCHVSDVAHRVTPNLAHVLGVVFHAESRELFIWCDMCAETLLNSLWTSYELFIGDKTYVMGYSRSAHYVEYMYFCMLFHVSHSYGATCECIPSQTRYERVMSYLMEIKHMLLALCGRLTLRSICIFVCSFLWSNQVLCTMRPVFATSINRIYAFSFDYSMRYAGWLHLTPPMC